MTTMYARRNSDGVSVNESAICSGCMWDEDAEAASLAWWRDADDVDGDTDDDSLHPVDNPDARCNGCGCGVPDNQPAPDGHDYSEES